MQTILPSLFRKVPGFTYFRERIITKDDDFLDLDWGQKQSQHKRLVVISHGLEGHSNRHYVKGMAHNFLSQGWDVLAWNFRGCSGEPNRTAGFYHSGASNDLREVLVHVQNSGNWDYISLVGFSMGGNITLKYLGEEAASVSTKIKSAAVFSVPVDLTTSAEYLARPRCRIYMTYFLRKLHRKIRQKQSQFPVEMDDTNFRKIRTFQQFDDRYTAPLHGFSDAKEYWKLSSSLPYLPKITIPTLLVNAQDDPFLSPECFPGEAQCGAFVSFLCTKFGGHVGFWEQLNRPFWSERIAEMWCRKSI